jgi:transposase
VTGKDDLWQLKVKRWRQKDIKEKNKYVSLKRPRFFQDFRVKK